MFTKFSMLKITSAVVVCSISAGCIGGATSAITAAVNNGGSGGGSTGSYADALKLANGKSPTQTALTGTANYDGQVSVRTNANAANKDEAVVGDLAMTVNFASGATRPITATVKNLAGQINGTQTAITGELTTAAAVSDINKVSVTNLSILGTPTTFTGLSTGLRGKLTDPTGMLSGDALMTLQGDFKGANGQSASGANAVAITPASGSKIITGGTYYVNKK